MRQRGPRSTAQRLARLSAVLLVLVGELAFVLWVYHLDDTVADRRVALAQVEAGLDAGAPPQQVGAAADDLLDADVAGAAAVASAARALDPADPASVASLEAAVTDSEQRTERQRVVADWTAYLLLLGLFVVVCIGWFTWFRRLARRHRLVQEALTAHEVEARGERRLQALVHNSADVVAVLQGDSTATFVSPAALTVLGRRPDDVVGRRFVDLVGAEDRELLAQALARTDGREHELQLRLPHADGRELVVEGTVKDLHDDAAINGWVLTLRDITDRRRLEETLTHQAFHDSLTALPNRQLFTDRLEQALLRRSTTHDDLAVMFVDIDDFKLVNDTLGHHVGDDLLVAAAERMQQALRPQDTVARLGGDEFAVLLDGVDLTVATEIGQRVLDALTGTVVIDGQSHRLRGSAGLAGAGCGSETSRELMRNADVAMYHAKARGKGCLAAYDEQLHRQAMDLLALRGDLADAIAAGELLLHYQPTLELASHRVTGFEALVRWQHPVRGLLMPGDFIALAEDSGLVVPLGAWVLQEACRAGASLQHSVGPVFMAVNVAAQQLDHPDFYDTVVEALARSSMPAERLVLEVTETVVLRDVEQSTATLARLRGLGVRVAIDDFGTGYNSLSTLAVLPVDVLKVDRSFVDRLGTSEEASSVVEAILAMSTALRLETVAEGVEEDHQADWLREHHAVMAQGFLWSRPVALEEALDYLRSEPHAVLPVDLPASPSPPTAPTLGATLPEPPPVGVPPLAV